MLVLPGGLAGALSAFGSDRSGFSPPAHIPTWPCGCTEQSCKVSELEELVPRTGLMMQTYHISRQYLFGFKRRNWHAYRPRGAKSHAPFETWDFAEVNRKHFAGQPSLRRGVATRERDDFQSQLYGVSTI